MMMAMAERAARLLNDGFVVIDLETTGLDNDPQVEIVEVAITDHTGAVLLNTLVKPRGRIPAGAARVHGIHDADVVDAPHFEDVYPELARLLGGQCVVAYNFTFEQNILTAVCHRHGLPIIESDWRCAMRAYSAFRGQRGFIKLVDACAHERVDVVDAHRALGDCRMTLALIRKMAGA
jgi:DNA polymerase-3 subunit epsilon